MNELIRLNVGGERYTTTRATLTRYPGSMLGAMFSGSLATSIDEQGCFFIDRDGPMFRHVLNFLRSGRLSLPADFHQLNLLSVEADFYQIEDLIKELALLRKSAGGSYLEVCIDCFMFGISYTILFWHALRDIKTICKHIKPIKDLRLSIKALLRQKFGLFTKRPMHSCTAMYHYYRHLDFDAVVC